jgi:hypothetical protein
MLPTFPLMLMSVAFSTVYVYLRHLYAYTDGKRSREEQYQACMFTNNFVLAHTPAFWSSDAPACARTEQATYC